MTERIIVLADGNAHDRDDIGATPMTLAILAEAGLQSSLHTYVYACHKWGNASQSQFNLMEESALGGAARFGFNQNKFISGVDDTTLARNRITNAINAASEDDPLTVLLAGPIWILHEAVERANASQRQFVTVISHAGWNDDHDRKEHGYNGDDETLEDLGVNFVHIPKQDGIVTNNWDAYNWLENHSDADLRWVHDRMKNKPTLADPSDAGMAYYYVTGDQQGSIADLRNYFEGGVGRDLYDYI